ncbi:EAL domain-containing protein [Gymnodinialimonas ceratoperidinii]|uniref:EAL domain-containing protein n=1 Tax=Gymnodinialimonas ceratoperidinii TaxID=2856823 RepID=A0A8F6TXG7_9RHOB|nr:EAL domain-containing protein [Gymnodinialimonas ceratoperidinii]QXT39734.1 EAL domain-containing protein [Gymnodinialimonas ceratoperidinii]
MGENGGEVIEPGMGSPLDAAISQRDRGTLAMVQQALARGDARLAYQPIVRADGQGIAFYEGLIRILDETGRVIPARDFMGAVEDSDIGRQIDCAALRLGLATLQRNPGLRLSINMSARSVGYPRWMQTLRTFLRDNPTVVERLILEITESSVMIMPEIVAIFMEDLQDKGITFALDDFGAGYTAFRHFKSFYFDILKIDGQFTRNIAEDADNQVLSEAMIGLARHFDMLVVSESVETMEEARWLAAAGADCLQGYYYGAPTMTLPEIDTARVMRSA